MSSNPYRKDFPLLENNKVIYLDNAATSQRPEAVIQAEAQFYEKYNANPLRGLYEPQTATKKQEKRSASSLAQEAQKRSFSPEILPKA